MAMHYFFGSKIIHGERYISNNFAIGSFFVKIKENRIVSRLFSKISMQVHVHMKQQKYIPWPKQRHYRHSVEVAWNHF